MSELLFCDEVRSDFLAVSENLRDKILDARRIITEAINTHAGDHRLVARAVLFSGGNDSATLFHMMVSMKLATHAIHANTSIGIEATRQFVRDQCAAAGVELFEELPPETYRELVLKQGFPGPAHHFKMYQRLKERGLRQARRKLVTNPRKERAMFIAGRRKAESTRRNTIPEHERNGSVIWVSPLANWSKADLDEYRTMFNVPRNTVADALGMSGECLCGAFAEPGELGRIAALHPDIAAEITALEVEVLASGHIKEERCMWGWGAYRGNETPSQTGPLCSSCDFRSDAAKRSQLTPAVTDAYNRIITRRTEK